MRDWLAAEQRRVADQLRQGLLASGCVALLGEFRMGKTSTLRSLRDILPPPRVYISVAEVESTYTGDADQHFYQQVLQGLVDDWGEGPPADVSLSSPAQDMNLWDTHGWFAATLEQLARRRPLTILIDDADRLADMPWGEHLFRNLPGLMRRRRNVQVVLAGSGRLESWAEALRHQTGRAGLWDLIQSPVILLPVSLQTVRDEFLNHQPLALRLIELCGGHPYCLRYLSQGLQSPALSVRQLRDAIEEKVEQLGTKWDETFTYYWQDYDRLVRQICFLLTVNPEGLKPQALKSRLDRVSQPEFNQALEALRETGVLFEGAESQTVRLIQLFRDWYAAETGFLPQAQPDQAAPAPPTPAQVKARPTTELTFFPDKDLVLIRRERFLSQSELGISAGRLATIRTKVRRVPAAASQDFWDNLKVLADDLWVELQDKAWFQEIIRSVDDGYRLRFNIPVEMGEFPFELLPLDETGTRRIGRYAPVSRQLFKEGRYVERAPLSLPQAGQDPLRILVVAAEAGGEIVMDADGQVYYGLDAQIAGGGQAFRLARLRLEKEVAALHHILVNQPKLVGEVTFLTKNDLIYDTQEQGVSLRRLSPTAETFQELLGAPDRQFDALHFIGHGMVVSDKSGNPMQGGLLFEDRLVHLTELAGLLRAQGQLRFVYLSCCEGGKLDTNERTSDLLGLAHACVEAGVPAVLTMRWRIPVLASRMLSQAFYPAFFQTGALDQAFHAAVQHVYDQQRDLAKKVYAEAPVLFMH
jgi:hypothetical protein